VDKNLIPYNSAIFPYSGIVHLNIPRSSNLVANIGEQIGYNTVLAEYQKSELLQCYEINKDTKLSVLHGELVRPGDELAVVKESLLSRRKLVSDFEGVVKLTKDNILSVVGMEKREKVISGVIGNIVDFDNLNGTLMIEVKGNGLSPVFHWGRENFSGIVGKGLSAEIAFLSGIEEIRNLGEENNPKHVILAGLKAKELREAVSVLGGNKINFSIANSEDTSSGQVVKCITKTIGRRLFFKDGFFISTATREGGRKKWFATASVNGRVFVSDFRHGLISGKIDKLSGNNIEVNVSSGSIVKTHYLNVLKQ